MKRSQPTHFRTCPLCEAMCGIAVQTSEDQILSIRGDNSDVLSGGHLCPKAVALDDLHRDPDRLRQPQRRDGSTWSQIGWGEAFDEVAARLARIQRAHGRDAVAVFLGNPNVHSYGAMLYARALWRALRTTNFFSATSLDQLPHMLAAQQMFGHQLLMPVPDLDRTDYLLMLGANPAASNGSLMSAGNPRGRLAAIRARGGRVVVLDPRRTETARRADRHIFIRPGTDALLLFALLRELTDIGAIRVGRLSELGDGLDDVLELALEVAPEAVAARTAISASTISELARELAAASAPVCYGRIGVCTQRWGGLAAWLINVLNFALGRLDEPGGAMFATPAVDLVAMSGRGSFARRRSRVRGLPSFGGELPTAALAEEIETAGPGQIRALVTVAGNPVLSAPNGRRIDRALSSLDFMVAIDIYRNETTRHADLILPPTFGFERDHYDLAFHTLAVRNTAKYSPALFPRSPTARHDWEIFLALATRLRAGRGAGRIFDLASRPLAGLLRPARLLDHLLRTGPHGAGYRPGRAGLSLARLRAAPHGVDLGPLTPCLAERLATRDGRIAIAPAPFLESARQLLDELQTASAPSSSLALIGRRDLRSNNSWMHNCPTLMRGRDRCTLQMNPADAGALRTGQRVLIRSSVGEIEVPLELTDAVMPGVVSLPHGWGHARPGTALRLANAQPGASINDLTDDSFLDELSGNAAFSGVAVEVRPAPVRDDTA